MKKYLLLSVFFIVLSTSCKKDKIELEATPVYLPLELGNYWIYQNYKVDTIGNETAMQTYDSTVITRDTIIRNQTYQIYKTYTLCCSNIKKIEILRDSADCIINNKGKLVFVRNDFNHVFRTYPIIVNGSDTLGNIQYQMKKINGSVTVPAGSFENVLCVEGKINVNPNTHLPPNRTIEQKYAPEVGRIYESWYFLSSPIKYERRLVRYHIN